MEETGCNWIRHKIGRNIFISNCCTWSCEVSKSQAIFTTQWLCHGSEYILWSLELLLHLFARWLSWLELKHKDNTWLFLVLKLQISESRVKSLSIYLWILYGFRSKMKTKSIFELNSNQLSKWASKCNLDNLIIVQYGITAQGEKNIVFFCHLISGFQRYQPGRSKRCGCGFSTRKIQSSIFDQSILPYQREKSPFDCHS